MPELLIQSSEGDHGRFPLVKERVTIGRSRDSDICLPDQWLSRHHAEIRTREGAHYVVDLGSKNGTLLKGNLIAGEQRLADGDVIKLGDHTLTYRVTIEEEVEEPEPLGTRIFSARELSTVDAHPAEDPAELLRQNRLLVLLKGAAEDLLVHRPLPQIFNRILDLLMDAVPAERAAILLLEDPGKKPTIKASRSRHGTPITSVSRTIARRVISERVSVLLPNVLADTSLTSQESILSSGIRSAVCAPLLYIHGSQAENKQPAVRSDEVIGLVYLDSLVGTHAFTEEDALIVTALAKVAAAKIENARLLEESLEKRRLEEDMRVAAQVQRSLLPREAPVLPGWTLAGSNRPCRTVGGDYFDFGRDGDSVLLALGDVSGKGTGAALLMTALRTAVRAHWTDTAPGEAMARINRTVCENIPEGKFVTFFLARLDPATGFLIYVNAGHNPPLLARADGAIETLTEGGMVLGLLDSVPYADAQVQMQPGDALVIYSDGVTETWNAEDKEFGDDGLTALVAAHRHLDAPALEARILEELETFAAGAGATDDRTIIVLKRQ